jgi:hypothetical protein
VAVAVVVAVGGGLLGVLEVVLVDAEGVEIALGVGNGAAVVGVVLGVAPGVAGVAIGVGLLGVGLFGAVLPVGAGLGLLAVSDEPPPHAASKLTAQTMLSPAAYRIHL